MARGTKPPAKSRYDQCSARPDDPGVADYTGRSSRYLTDGVHLYRVLGAMASGMGQMISLEDCWSLELLLVPVGELRARQLRSVVPVDDS